MTRFLLLLTMLQLSQAPTGAASGVVLSSNGVPAGGVRVYAIPAGDPNVVTNSAAVFESLALTDAMGRYRLEVPAGRYYIAAGSVNSPTYYPNESNIVSAKIVTVAAGTTVEGVNFSKFVPATQSPLGRAGPILPSLTPALPPGSTGVLSGVIHYPDGTPASGVSVVAVPVSALNNPPGGGLFTITASFSGFTSLQTGPGQSIRLTGGGISTDTDSTGRYRIQFVSPDTYKIVAGFSESPEFYPGTTDLNAATAITTTPTTMMDALDFTIPAPVATFVRAHVSATDGSPVGGATVNMRSLDRPPIGVAAYLPQRTYKQLLTVGDGIAEFTGVRNGRYTISAGTTGVTSISKTIDIKDQSSNLEFTFPISVLSGHVLWEDGSPFSDPVLNQVAVSTTSNPNAIMSSILTLSKSGDFSGVLESDTYRFFIRNLPQGLQVRSVTSGTADLTKESFKFDGGVPMNIEVRIAKKSNTTQTVTGKVVDVLTGMPPSAERVQLCCIGSGPVERLSTDLRSDGSFEFSGVSPGHYEAELTGKKAFGVANRFIEIGNEGKSGLTLMSAAQFAALTIGISFEAGVQRPADQLITVTLTPTSGPAFDIPITGSLDGVLWASVPSGVEYKVSVSNLPAGYKVKSFAGRAQDQLAGPPGIAPSPNASPEFAGTYKVSGSSSVTIVLTRSQ